jgi:hypothetical protein
MKAKIVLPWHYVIMVVLGLGVLWLLLARYGRSPPVLIGWVIVSRGVDFLMRRRRRKPMRFDREEETPPEA